jgi:hypothetical protein
MFIESPYCSYYVAIHSGFRVSIRVSGIHGFGFGDGLSLESVFGAVSGFDFWVLGLGAQRFHPIRIRPVAILRYELPRGILHVARLRWASCMFELFISHVTVFFSLNKTASVNLSVVETISQTRRSLVLAFCGLTVGSEMHGSVA